MMPAAPRIRFRPLAEYLNYVWALLLVGLLTSALYRVVHYEKVVFAEAEEALSKKEYDEAMDLYIEAVDLGLKDRRVKQRIGELCMRAEDYDQAEQIYTELHRDFPADEGYVASLAGIQQMKGDAVGAVQLYEEFLKSNSLTRPEHGVHLGDLYRQQQRYDKAESIYRLVLHAYPGHFQCERHLAQMLSWTGRYDEALALYRGLLEREPGRADLRNEYAKVLGWSGRASEAIEQYRKAGKPQP